MAVLCVLLERLLEALACAKPIEISALSKLGQSMDDEIQLSPPVVMMTSPIALRPHGVSSLSS